MTRRKPWVVPSYLDIALAEIAVSGDQCVLWRGFRDKDGYGTLSRRAPRPAFLRAHRVVYERLIGPIPSGLHIDHLCRNTGCVNLRHLEPVTPRENTLRGTSMVAQNAFKTHCPQAHPYDGSNLVINRAGRRVCRICRREARRRCDQRQRETKRLSA